MSNLNTTTIINSSVSIPAEILKDVNLYEGKEVIVRAFGAQIVIEPVGSPTSNPMQVVESIKSLGDKIAHQSPGLDLSAEVVASRYEE